MPCGPRAPGSVPPCAGSSTITLTLIGCGAAGGCATGNGGAAIGAPGFCGACAVETYDRAAITSAIADSITANRKIAGLIGLRTTGRIANLLGCAHSDRRFVAKTAWLLGSRTSLGGHGFTVPKGENESGV